jgi:hypothetical protein
LLYNLYFSCSDDEEPPTCATAVSPPSPVATDELVEPYVAPRTTRASVKKVSQTQARAQKRAKKTKEAEVSLEAHASTVSSECAGYLKVAKASEGAILITSSLCSCLTLFV